MNLYRGYVPTKDKAPLKKFKSGQELMTLEQVQKYSEFAGVLDVNTILIDVDDSGQSDILMEIVEDLQLDCKVLQTTRGRHFLFKNTDVKQCYTHTKTACGLIVDIKVGCKNSTEVLKFDGQDRFVEWDVDEGQEYQELPKWMHPVKTDINLLGMKTGDGRNNDFFRYERILQEQRFEVEDIRTSIRIANKYILKESLPDDELETILRDEAFEKPVFFNGKTFLHDRFAEHLKTEFHIKKIGGLLYVYDKSKGIYVSGHKTIEDKMCDLFPSIKSSQRNEVLKYLEIRTKEEGLEQDNAHLIVFNNGTLNLKTMELKESSPEDIITNRIPWDWNPDAYSEAMDKVFDNVSCGDEGIRALLEEMFGYCFYRSNEKSKSFILTGTGANGKSTILDMLKFVLGRENYVSLDLSEVAERFSTSSMVGKLANIGDDINDEFLQGKQIATFKKLTSGNDLKAEDKGQDVFFFKPYCKLLFSTNEIPRFQNKGFYAIKRRMEIIPFNATFKKGQEGYSEHITWNLKTPEVAEYIIRLGVNGLKNILENGFTESELVQKQLDEFERDNSPVLQFMEEVDESEILNHTTDDVFIRFQDFCLKDGMMTTMKKETFVKQMNQHLGSRTEPRKVLVRVGKKQEKKTKKVFLK